MIEEIGLDLIGSYGFPIFVCLWFMLRTEKIIKGNTEALNGVRIAVSGCPNNKINFGG